MEENNDERIVLQSEIIIECVQGIYIWTKVICTGPQMDPAKVLRLSRLMVNNEGIIIPKHFSM